MNKTLIFFAQGLGVGRIPLIPATFGTLWGVFLWMVLRLSLWMYLLITLLIIVTGVFLSNIAEEESEIKDDRRIVVDEIAGFMVTMIGLPKDVAWMVAGFIIFRLLDIAKPPPCRWAHNLSGGVGIVADDIIAGAMGCVILHIFRWLTC
jgi:phosphatidylglycerophosphatase A